jgi:hypothetical protein
MVATAMMTLRLEQEGQLHFSFLHCQTMWTWTNGREEKNECSCGKM